ncbi:MAG: hypothetical protein Q8O14_03580 [bacterium]|nr:hypothetical protein [bacterium]
MNVLTPRRLSVRAMSGAGCVYYPALLVALVVLGLRCEKERSRAGPRHGC